MNLCADRLRKDTPSAPGGHPQPKFIRFYSSMARRGFQAVFSAYSLFFPSAPCFFPFFEYFKLSFGEMVEWFKASVLKTDEG